MQDPPCHQDTLYVFQPLSRTKKHHAGPAMAGLDSGSEDVAWRRGDPQRDGHPMISAGQTWFAGKYPVYGWFSH